MQKMVNSGVKLQQIRRTFIGGLSRYEKLLKWSRLEGDGHRPLHQDAGSSQGARSRKKLVGKSSWYKDTQRDKDDSQVDIYKLIDMAAEGNRREQRENQETKQKMRERKRAKKERRQAKEVDKGLKRDPKDIPTTSVC